MKKILFVLTAGLLLLLSGCGENAPSRETLSPLVAKAIIQDNENGYLEGECSAEGHMILGSSISGGNLKVYALTMYGNYGFQNGMFIKISGSGIIPAVLSFEKDGSDYKLLEIEYPQDGAKYTESIKRMFPLKYRSAALHCDSAYNGLLSQERSYAEAYLKSIGRKAYIGEYRDLEIVLLTDLGVSVDVSNKLIRDERLGEYPYWIGTAEYLESGKRYVRSLSLDVAAGQIVYKTVEAESGETTESFVFDAVTGEEIVFPTENTDNLQQAGERHEKN